VFHLEEAEFEVDELLEEHVLGGSDGLVFFEEVMDGDGDEVWVHYEMLVIFHGVEAMLEGIGGRAGFARGGTGAGGFFGVCAVGVEGGFGHRLLTGLVGGSLWSGWQRIHRGVWSFVFHGVNLTRMGSGLMFARGGFVGKKGNRVLKML
jgi:hypothetical protein